MRDGLLVALCVWASAGPAFARHPPPDEPVVHEFEERALTRLQVPYAAWSNAAAAHIRKSPSVDALDIGYIRRGDWIIVKDVDGAWASLDPVGYVRLSDLRTGPQSEGQLAQATFQRFVYGTVLEKRADAHAEPDASSSVIKRYPRRFVLAFRDEAPVNGWLQRPGRGWVRASDVRLAKASEFSGVHGPTGALAFFLADVTVEGQSIARHETRPALGVQGAMVRVPEGLVPRNRVRLAFARHRPSPVRAGQKWVHVDLREQVLTAYEGDTWVYATLVSTGRAGHATTPGVYRVQQKVAHTAMDSERDHYYVDEVPYIQYFNNSQGFHAAFWHDRFGNVASHGCVNLSVDDAAWLFEWSNPPLPAGWQNIITFSANLASMWVHIDGRAGVGDFAAPLEAPRPLSTVETH